MACFLRCLILFDIYLVTLLTVFAIMMAAGRIDSLFLATPFILASFVVNIFLVISSISLYVRRLHDMNLSGLWYLIIITVILLRFWVIASYGSESAIVLLLTIACLIMYLILLIYPSIKGYNKFGADLLMRNRECVDSVFGDGPERTADEASHRPYDPEYGSHIKKTPQKRFWI